MAEVFFEHRASEVTNMAKIRLDIPAPPSVAGAAPQPTNYPIPNLPKMGGVSVNLPAIPQPDFGQGITARYKAPDPINPDILKPLDIEGKVPMLMQSEIDPGPYVEAGKAAARQGLAVASAGAAIGGALNDLAMLSQGLQHSKDSADISRAHNIINLGTASFEETAVNAPMSERLTLWKEQKALIDAGLRSIGMSASVGDRISAEWQIAEIKQRTKINHDARQEMIKNDTEAIHDEIKNAMASGDFVQAAGAIGRLGAAGLAKPAQVSHLNKQLNEERQAWDIQQLINSNPRAGLQEMQEFNATGKSDIFPNLKNPAIAARAEIAAREAVNRREIDASEAIKDGINAGRLKDKQDIEIAARGNLTPERIEAYSRALAANPEYSSKAVMQARSNVEGYDFKKDPDLSQLHAINQQILTTVPKTEQGVLMDALDEKVKDKKLKSDQDPPQWYASSLLKEFEALTDNGYFDVPGKVPYKLPGLYSLFGPVGTTEKKLDRKKLEKDPIYALTPEVKAMERAAWDRAKTAQDTMRQWLIDNPKATPKEAREQMTSYLKDEANKYRGEDAKPPAKAAVPTAPATPAPEGPPTSPPISSTRASEAHTVARITAYRPGGTREMGVNPKIEGGPLDAHGNMILGKSTMEDYAEGRGNYVTVAMDKESDWQGKYLISAAYPGVVFKVMDNGGYGNGKTGRDWVDIAWKDPEMAKRFTRRNITFQTVDYRDAKRIANSRYST